MLRLLTDTGGRTDDARIARTPGRSVHANSCTVARWCKSWCFRSGSRHGCGACRRQSGSSPSCSTDSPCPRSYCHSCSCTRNCSILGRHTGASLPVAGNSENTRDDSDLRTMRMPVASCASSSFSALRPHPGLDTHRAPGPRQLPRSIPAGGAASGPLARLLHDVPVAGHRTSLHPPSNIKGIGTAVATRFRVVFATG